MDQRWRPFPPQPNFNATLCPTCSTPHFPLCPPPPFNHTFAIPPPPPPPPPPPYPPPPHHPPPPPPPSQAYAFNQDIRYQAPDNYYGYRPGYVGAEGDGNFRKRMRVDVGPDPAAHSLGFPRVFSEDERRSKLIRDHGSGAVVGNVNNCYGSQVANQGSYQGYNNYTSLGDRIHPFQRQPVYGDPRGEISAEISKYGGGNVGGGNHHPTPTQFCGAAFNVVRPLPASPPPPLPADPPVQSSLPNEYGFSQLTQRASTALFPVYSNVSTTSPSTYYHTRQIPRASPGFGEGVKTII